MKKLVFVCRTCGTPAVTSRSLPCAYCRSPDINLSMSDVYPRDTRVQTPKGPASAIRVICHRSKAFPEGMYQLRVRLDVGPIHHYTFDHVTPLSAPQPE
jgi:hypothetical protein